MPITSSAKKALRSQARKQVFNIRIKANIDRPMKELKKLASAKNRKGAEALVPAIYKALDKAAKKGVIKKNTASRKKSRVVAMVKKIA